MAVNGADAHVQSQGEWAEEVVTQQITAFSYIMSDLLFTIQVI